MPRLQKICVGIKFIDKIQVSLWGKPKMQEYKSEKIFFNEEFYLMMIQNCLND